jgi:hypothetical protein
VIPSLTPEDKFSCKGINKRTNQFIKDKYMDVLLSKKSGSSTDNFFQCVSGQSDVGAVSVYGTVLEISMIHKDVHKVRRRNWKAIRRMGRQ